MKHFLFTTLCVLVLFSCSEEEAPTKAAQVTDDVPPFSTLWISTTFSIPARESNEISNFEFLNTWSYYKLEKEPTNDYRYYTSLYDNLNNDNTVAVQLSETELAVNVEGVLLRVGEKLPIGSTEAWPESVNYILEVVANPVNKTVTSGLLKMSATGFNVEYDLSGELQFKEYDQEGMPEWYIYSKSAEFGPFSQFRISVSINDVVGTSIKN
jgi:hypothetical protein